MYEVMNIMNYNKVFNNDGTQIRIGEVRFSFLRIQEKNESGKYTTAVIIPNSNKESLKLINDAVQAAVKRGAEQKWKGKVPANLHLPLHDGDLEKPDDPACEDAQYLNASNTYQPKAYVLDDGDMYPAEEDQIYSGCYGAVCLSFYPYDTNGNRGIGVSLGNIIKTRDGEPLGGSAQSGETSFGDLV